MWTIKIFKHGKHMTDFHYGYLADISSKVNTFKKHGYDCLVIYE